MCFFAFFGAKIWPAAAGTGELARDLRDQTPDSDCERGKVPSTGRLPLAAPAGSCILRIGLGSFTGMQDADAHHRRKRICWVSRKGGEKTGENDLDSDTSLVHSQLRVRGG